MSKKKERSQGDRLPEREELEGTKGDDLLVGTAAADRIEGLAGDDLLICGEGRNTILGGAGNDRIYGDGRGKGHDGHDDGHRARGVDPFADVLDGGSGSDEVYGGRGDDTLIWHAGENVGARDRYDGGSGTDTVELHLDRNTWFDPTFQSDLARLRGWLASRTAGDHADDGGDHDHDGSDAFDFTAFDLSVRDVEQARVFVDGRELSLADDPVTAVDDAVSVDEDAGPTTFGSVLANDVVPDLARSVRPVSGPSAGMLVFRPGTDGDPDGSFVFDPGRTFSTSPRVKRRACSSSTR